MTSASAQDAGVSGVNLQDPTHQFTQPAANVEASLSQDQSARFATLSPASEAEDSQAPRALELELSAPGHVTGAPFDVSIAQRASLGSSDAGDFNRRGRGSEVRVGHSLGEPTQRRNAPEHRVYMFAASDDDAVTWAPGQQSDHGFALQQDRVQVGDHQAGVTYEHGNVQASVAYVEREISSTIGRTTFSKNENFAGVTLTMRH